MNSKYNTTSITNINKNNNTKELFIGKKKTDIICLLKIGGALWSSTTHPFLG